MPASTQVVLAINAGSSSVKFALYRIAGAEENLLFAGYEDDLIKNQDWAGQLMERPDFAEITVIAHRVVHGMAYTHPEMITPALIEELKTFINYDPEHLPAEIKLIELFFQRFPQTLQYACFDTMFHHTLPPVAQTLGIPRKYGQKGIRRYGFHGLSYQYLTEQLNLLNTDAAQNDKVVIAHLGSGASLAAIKNGRSIDTSMGFTPCAGILMSTRSGDLDPGVAAYLMQQEKFTPEQFNHLVNHESGLLGVSEISSDIRELLDVYATDERAAQAVDLFCYQIGKYIGSFAVALAGITTLVFSGGIGEHLPEVREKICRNLDFLGIELNADENLKNADIISAGKICVRVISTNEALMMARLITRLLPNNN
jgi:acetate kinase